MLSLGLVAIILFSLTIESVRVKREVEPRSMVVANDFLFATCESLILFPLAFLFPRVVHGVCCWNIPPI